MSVDYQVQGVKVADEGASEEVGVASTRRSEIRTKGSKGEGTVGPEVAVTGSGHVILT